MGKKIINKLSILFKAKRKLLTVVILCVFVIEIGSSIIWKETSSASSKTILADSGALTLSKTVKKIEKADEYDKDDQCDEYDITFKVNGTPGEKKIMANIVIMVDESGSMNKDNKLSLVKSSIKDFCDGLINTDADVKIAIGGFSSELVMGKGELENPKLPSYLHLGDNEKDSRRICPFSSAQDASNLVNNIGNRVGEYATNTEAGIYRAGKLLDEGRQLPSENSESGTRSEAKEYVIFFTDGLPRYAHSQVFNLKYYDSFFKAAQNKYNDIFGLTKGINNNGKVLIGGIGEASSTPNTWDNGVAKEITAKVNAPHKDAKFYTIGVITDGKGNDNLWAQKFLYSIQNVVNTNQNDYVTQYYNNESTAISKIYKKIKEEIVKQISPNIALNAEITDEVTSNFTIIPTQKVNGVNSFTISGNEIAFKLGNVGGEGIEFSFRIKVANPYFSGTDIDTNVKATIKYKDPIKPTSVKTQEFNIPKVNIDSKIGTVKIEKVVENSKDSIDKFSVLMNRTSNPYGAPDDQKGSYAFDITGNSNGTIEFFMKDKATNITHNKDMTKNYLNVGEYSINEIVPIYYQLKDIKVDYNDGKGFIDLKTGNKITIDKDHKNITIKVTNNKIDCPYWWDKTDIPNSFTYSGIAPS